MAASKLRQAPTAGVEGEMAQALACAFTAEMFFRLPFLDQKDRSKIVLRDSEGRKQVIFRDGQWIVCGWTWGKYEVPQRILFWAAQRLKSKAKQEVLFSAVTEAIHTMFGHCTREHLMLRLPAKKATGNRRGTSQHKGNGKAKSRRRDLQFA